MPPGKSMSTEGKGITVVMLVEDTGMRATNKAMSIEANAMLTEDSGVTAERMPRPMPSVTFLRIPRHPLRDFPLIESWKPASFSRKPATFFSRDSALEAP